MKIVASGPITSWQIDTKTMETVTDFILLGSKITADGDCSLEIKRRFAPWKKSYDQPRMHIKKQRHYFAKKVFQKFYELEDYLFWILNIMRNAGLEKA